MNRRREGPGLGPAGGRGRGGARVSPREPAAAMATARYYPTATLLSDGRMLVTGGQGTGGVYLSSAELYTPDNSGGPGTWSSAGSMTTGRYGQTATLLPDGRVLVTGGINSS